MKGKGWKLNPHWVMRHDQKRAYDAARLAERLYFEQQKQISDTLRVVQGQSDVAVKH